LDPPSAGSTASGEAFTSSDDSPSCSYDGFDTSRPPKTQQQHVDKILNVSVLAAVGVVGLGKLLAAEEGLWDIYQHAVASNPVETKVMRSNIQDNVP
jgi:hypothetical protein